MRVIKVIFTILIIIIFLVLVALFVLVKTFDVDKYKTQITQAAAKALAREVDFKDIDLEVSLKNGIQLAIKELSIKDDPSFSENNFLTVRNISLGVDIVALAAKKEIAVSSVTVEGVRCTLIRSEEGAFNVASLGHTEDSAAKQQEHSAPANYKDTTAKVSALPVIVAQSITATDIALEFIDKMRTPYVRCKVSEGALSVDHFSLDKPFTFTIEAAFFSLVKNIELKGTVVPNVSSMQFSLRDAELKVDFSRVSFVEIRNAFSLAQEVPLPDTCKGELTVSLDSLTFDQQGVGQLSLDVEFSKGALRFSHLIPQGPLDVSNIELSISDIALNSPFQFSLSASYLSELPNIRLAGGAFIDKEKHAFQVTDTTCAADVSSFSLKQLADTFTTVDSAMLPQQITGNVSASLTKLYVQGPDIISLMAQVSVKNGSIKHKKLAQPIRSITLDALISEKDITVNTLSFDVGRGEVSAHAALYDYKTTQNFTAECTVKDVDIEDVLNQEEAPYTLKGLVNVTMKARGRGLSDEALRTNLAANGTAELTEGAITDINLLKIALDKIAIIPHLSEKIQEKLPQKYKEKLIKKDTDISKLKTDIAVKEGVADLQGIEAEADGFSFLGDGKVSFDKNLYVSGTFLIPPDLAQSMTANVEELGYLLDEEGNMSFPFEAQGVIPDLSYKVDVQYTAKEMLKEKAADELGKVLDKVFDREKDEQPQDAENQDVPQKEQEKPLEQQVIENILDKIFK